QRDWMHREAYLQCGYYDQPGVRGIVPCIAVAMTLYDSGVCLEEIEDPAKQPPIPSTPEDAAEFESAVRNHYRSGVAVLSNHLLEHRTRVLVECQAILLGRDPQVEYDRFLKAGGWYYLQYPELCP
ncbi:hypothetical protein KJ815_14255, partial [bacterium]|nr:hypothetical protein [bacterium]